MYYRMYFELLQMYGIKLYSKISFSICNLELDITNEDPLSAQLLFTYSKLIDAFLFRLTSFSDSATYKVQFATRIQRVPQKDEGVSSRSLFGI